MKKSDKGLTLVEVMIAVAILVVVISGIMATYVHCLMLNETNQNRVTAMNLAQYVLEDMQGVAFSQLEAYTAPTAPVTNLRNEAITVAAPVSVNSRLKYLNITVSWMERGTTKNVSLSTYVSRTSD